MLSSGLVLGAISPMLKALLSSVPRLDPYVTVMLPEVGVDEVKLLNRVVFEERVGGAVESREEEEMLRRIVRLLGCDNLVKVTEKVGNDVKETGGGDTAKKTTTSVVGGKDTAINVLEVLRSFLCCFNTKDVREGIMH